MPAIPFCRRARSVWNSASSCSTCSMTPVNNVLTGFCRVYTAHSFGTQSSTKRPPGTSTGVTGTGATVTGATGTGVTGTATADRLRSARAACGTSRAWRLICLATAQHLASAGWTWSCRLFPHSRSCKTSGESAESVDRHQGGRQAEGKTIPAATALRDSLLAALSAWWPHRDLTAAPPPTCWVQTSSCPGAS